MPSQPPLNRHLEHSASSLTIPISLLISTTALICSISTATSGNITFSASTSRHLRPPLHAASHHAKSASSRQTPRTLCFVTQHATFLIYTHHNTYMLHLNRHQREYRIFSKHSTPPPPATPPPPELQRWRPNKMAARPLGSVLC